VSNELIAYQNQTIIRSIFRRHGWCSRRSYIVRIWIHTYCMWWRVVCICVVCFSVYGLWRVFDYVCVLFIIRGLDGMWWLYCVRWFLLCGTL